MIPPGLNYANFVEEEYHAFWNKAFSDNTIFLISAPGMKSSSIKVDFYEIRRRNELYDEYLKYNYEPFGVLLPLVDYVGAYFFHCNETKTSLLH